MQVFADDGACIDACADGRKDSRPIVLIHGFPFARAIWDAQSAALARRAYVIRPDLRGAGKSSVPDGPYLMETCASDVAGLLDVLGIERATLVGHSMGGYVALAFARMFTERVARLALVSSRLIADTPEQAGARRALAARVERECSIEPVIEAYLPRLLAPDTAAERPEAVERAYAIARRNDPLGAAAALRGMALRASSEDIAGDLSVPVLIVAGGLDAVVPVEESRAIAASFPVGRLVVCERSGHLPMLEEPDCVCEALSSWFNE
ncbi:MAG TPA: alpha/beta hydrolase [Candidatus Cybelea sp.]|jgi:pimeloyl-ACP methyl ester carboxylesterase|nr:alpha/beta hydrolase [Candidatus Cybelea sp.]